MTEEPNDLLEAQLRNGYRAIDAPDAWQFAAENESGYTPVFGHVGTDVIHTEEFDIVDERDFAGAEEPNPPVGNHGTEVVSQAAAETGNDLGMAGVSNAKVVVAQIVGEKYDRSYPVRVGEAIRWLADHPEGVDVINMSWSFSRFYAAELYHAIEYARNRGVLVITSAGNDGMTNSPRKYPHVFDDLENSITVAATEGNNDHLAGFSNFGDWVEIAAPGARVPGLIPDQLFRGENDNPGRPWELVYTWGTSFASPIVAGVALLMLRVNPDLRNHPLVLKRLLMGTAEPLDLTGPVSGGAGAGRVDAFAAVRAANDPIRYINEL